MLYIWLLQNLTIIYPQASVKSVPYVNFFRIPFWVVYFSFSFILSSKMIFIFHLYPLLPSVIYFSYLLLTIIFCQDRSSRPEN